MKITPDDMLVVTQRVDEILSSPSRWTKGRLARDEFGSALVDPTNPHAVCWCISGAAIKAKTDLGYFDNYLLDRAVAQQIAQCDVPPDWNDADETTFGDVKQRIAETIEYLRAESEAYHA